VIYRFLAVTEVLLEGLTGRYPLWYHPQRLEEATMEIPIGFALIALEFNMANDSGLQVCTFGVQHSATTPAGAVDVCNDVFDAWDADLAPITSDEVTLSRVTGLLRIGGGALLSAESSRTPKAGESTLDTLPGVLAAVLRKRTTFAGREFRGRIYHPGLLSDNDVGNDSLITSGRQIEINAAATDFLNTLDGLAHDMFLLHSDPATSPTAVTSFVVSPQVGTIRRRRDR
jgi:hypothetical protein